MTALAIVCALVAAALFAVAAVRQHSEVTDLAVDGAPGLRTLARLLRSPGWWAGTGLAVGGSLLHVVALALAPLPVVQPLGVFSLVLTVLFGRNARRVVTAVVLVVAGVAGFVALAASATPAAAISAGTAELVAVAGFAVAGLAWFARAGCAALAAAAAVLFGLGSSVVHAAASQAPTTAILLGGQALLLLGAGGVILHRAYAAGPAAVVVGTTTVLDPLTAVAVAALAFGEVPRPAAALAAVVALAGVRVLAGAVPHVPSKTEEKPVHPTGLRVLIGADTFPPDINGAAFFAARLARGLAERGHDVHVVCPSDDGPARTEERDGYTIHRLRAHAIPFHRDYRFCTPGGARPAVGELLDRIRPDVVHVQAHFGVGRALLETAAARDVPGMATNHFMPDNLLGYTPFPRRVKNALARWAWRDLKRVYRDARIVTTPTPRAAEVLAGIGLDRPVQVVSCGIDLTHYAAPPRPADRPMSVLFVGRLDAEKNIDQLLRALAPLPHVRADLVGDGTRRHELQELTADLGIGDRVTFHGFVPDADLVHRYAAADVFCMPGTAELQSLATMEAMAAGLPVVAADALALPHLVHHGENGYLFAPGSITTISRWIADLAADPAVRARMGEASRAIVARHDIDGALAAFETQYRILTGLPAAAAVNRAA
ncbi:Glycosyltransferase involved in cell wall bisynthesis [Amycolatopsis pretoriensis]|uniref:Glycosyltransferase involved in cell wall bisynthesis n=1 Tax=Amycolatopsis pretoriensis TaxID=218821 RepID=A0A1H5RHB0_9PSEU|nr:glycosyltransferase family 4 protein [Amycolatopsis pretoriensis]SEF37763.1 Glycosyltransferase involved in cell wall bisynthesis [Amycolatopsis pretoriensis]